ncbi:hypothetical protein HMPREF0548_1746 [Lactobacillus ultunensis DSM 16047]|uniref:Uncharacterized protein n=1 Tax=Lactobacillus ultunensis DSM 16047 TaxID=525365 RepID=C2EQ00_9LACO|nr:hypothetical protein HMPREF0548_1746 [Lactobacillus ultunensis DSM 16047]
MKFRAFFAEIFLKIKLPCCIPQANALLLNTRYIHLYLNRIQDVVFMISFKYDIWSDDYA